MVSTGQQEFDCNINQYETRKRNNPDFEGVTPLTSHVDTRLGVIIYKRNDADQEVIRLNQFMAVASPVYQGYYTTFICDILYNTGSKIELIESYTNAISIAQ